MTTRKFIEVATGLFDRVFVDRDIIVRADGRVRSLRVARRLEISALGVLVATVAWLLYASANLYLDHRDLAAKERELGRWQDAYQQVVSAFEAYRDRVSEVSGSLRDQQAKVLFRRADEEPVVAVPPPDNAGLRIERLEAALAQAIEARAELEAELDEAINREDRLSDQHDYLQRRAARLKHQLNRVSAEYNDILARVSAPAVASLDLLERTVAMTGVDVSNLLTDEQVRDLGYRQGGPFESGDYIVESDPYGKLQGSMALLQLQMDRWEALLAVAPSLPLASPLDQYRLSSRFGARRDPVNGRKAAHPGLDLSAPLRTPVLATAPGRVVFAGWLRDYGRLIEIDHGNGIRTRYGHLHKILVEKGQQVEHREKIGLLGRSGRTTGPHVHYEVLVNDKPYDPAKFLSAGKNVFQG